MNGQGRHDSSPRREPGRPIHCPYHFVPTPAPPNEMSESLADNAWRRMGALSGLHEVYSPGACSGRIVCCLRAQTPLFIGQSHKKDGLITPYRLGGELAIPGSTLKGLLTSVVEAASASTLRVLEKQSHSRFASVSAELLPMHAGRQRMTLAELLFGFVSDEVAKVDYPQALAGRVRISPALAFPPVHAESAILRRSFGPRGECARLYLTKDGLGKNVPQGRKFYLHAGLDERTPWLGHGGGRGARHVDVLPAGASFWFHIDFDQLTREWLALLVFALSPTVGHCHKLGLGKPLGLGSVLIEPVLIALVDRQARYTADGLKSGRRYAGLWRDERVDPAKPPPYYKREWDSAPGEPVPSVPELRACWTDLMRRNGLGSVLASLLALGNRQLVKSQRDYPINRPGQLRPIPLDGESIPTFE